MTARLAASGGFFTQFPNLFSGRPQKQAKVNETLLWEEWREWKRLLLPLLLLACSLWTERVLKRKCWGSCGFYLFLQENLSRSNDSLMRNQLLLTQVTSKMRFETSDSNSTVFSSFSFFLFFLVAEKVSGSFQMSWCSDLHMKSACHGPQAHRGGRGLCSGTNADNWSFSPRRDVGSNISVLEGVLQDALKLRLKLYQTQRESRQW